MTDRPRQGVTVRLANLRNLQAKLQQQRAGVKGEKETFTFGIL